MAKTDERVREDVSDILVRDPDIAESDIELQVADGVVTLTGTVQDDRARRRVEESIQSVPGVKGVDNQLRISQGLLNEVLNDFSATGTSAGRETSTTDGTKKR